MLRECIVETHNIPAALMTLSLLLWNSIGTALGGWYINNKAAGGFFGFQKATSEHAGKEGNLQHDI
jgi:hypothetical protein